MPDDEFETLFHQLLGDGLVENEDRLLLECMKIDRIRRKLDVLEQRTRYITLALEAVDSGHNQAAAMRSAEAFGVQDVAVIRGRKPFRPARKLTQSAHKWQTIRQFDDAASCMEHLQASGYRIWAGHLGSDAVALDEMDLSQPAALVFGNEHDGCSDEVLQRAHARFMIPMQGFVKSLNVSVAAAIALYTATRLARPLARDRYPLTLEEKRSLFCRWMRNSSPRISRLAELLEHPRDDETPCRPPDGP